MESENTLQPTQKGLIKQTEGDRIKSELQRKMDRFKEENKIARQKKEDERNSKAIEETVPIFIDSFATLCRWNQDINSQQLASLSKEEMLELDKMITRRAKQILRWAKTAFTFFFLGPWIFTFSMVYLSHPIWLFCMIPELIISCLAGEFYFKESISRKFLKARKHLLVLRKEENFFPYERVLELKEKNKEDENEK